MNTCCYINVYSSIHPAGEVDTDGILWAVEPDYKEIIADANLRRRMSRLVKMGVACGLDCLRQEDMPPVDAIITATGLGCLQDTEKFLNALIEREEQMLNPTPFIQSTFNVIGAQIALLTGNHGYNNTFVHRGLSFESALLDGMIQIAEGCRNVLVGAVDEATVTSRRLQKQTSLSDTVCMGEGAAFFMLSGDLTPTTVARLQAIRTGTGKLSPERLANELTAFLREQELTPADINRLFIGGKDGGRQAEIYSAIERLFSSQTSKYTFKDTCGEYPTASAFGLWKALSLAPSFGKNDRMLLCNHDLQNNYSFLLLQSEI